MMGKLRAVRRRRARGTAACGERQGTSRYATTRQLQKQVGDETRTDDDGDGRCEQWREGGRISTERESAVGAVKPSATLGPNGTTSTTEFGRARRP